MEKDQAERLLEKLKTDEAFARKVANCKTTADRVVVLVEAGFHLDDEKKPGRQSPAAGSAAVELPERNVACLFAPGLRCLRDMIHAACLCAVNRAHKQRVG